MIIPVPLHRWRLWKRGFNQAAMLGRELDSLGHGRLLVDGLERRKQTPSLGGMGARKREKILAGSIVVASKAQPLISGKDVILVDDVLTSGATSNACVQQLKRNGARSVVVACFARVLDESLDTVR
ncbi:ComF family protein [Qipengyuania psychrotolerans]|uniref:ComF family protein n=1 Tax=Qipengyuania psychrotolerans TaxID=2867238 RepID=UPI0031E9FA38